MKRVPLSPARQVALNEVLAGEFDFFGLISTLPQLSAPVHSWAYTRSAGEAERTVECGAIQAVPHGHDAQVMRALLSLHQRQAPLGPRPRVHTDGRELHAVLALFGVPSYLDDTWLLRSLDRLHGTLMRLTSIPPVGRGRTARFSLLDALEYQGHVEDGVYVLGQVVCSISASVLSMAGLESLREVPPSSETPDES
jgi:hypothetical protein